MRKSTSIAAAVVAALALTLTGCGEDDEKDSGAADTSDKSQSQTGGSDAKSSPSPSPSTSRKSEEESESPSPSPTVKSGEKRSDGTSGGNSGGTSGGSGGGSDESADGGGGAQSIQGAWYFPVRDKNGALLSLTISGSSMTISGPKGKCNGTANGLAVTMSCTGETVNGQAVVTAGGQKLELDWKGDLPSDRFTREKPSA